MKSILIIVVFILVGFYSTTSNTSNNRKIVNDVSINEANSVDSLQKQRYSGVWVHQDSARFIIIDMEDLNNVRYYNYINREIAIGVKNSKIKPTIMKFQGQFKSLNDSCFILQFGRYPYTFLFRADTIYFMTEIGNIEPCIQIWTIKN